MPKKSSASPRERKTDEKSRQNIQPFIEPTRRFTEKPVFFILVIITLTFLVFIPSLKNDFINTWDDGINLTNNPLIKSLSPSSIKEIFTTSVAGSYVPLSLLSFSIEYKIAGLNPGIFHLTNLLLHLLCTFLVFLILRRFKLKPVFAAFGALLFGIHPMHVESVAWISERKDLLCALFSLASILFYINYLNRHSNKLLFFLLSLLLFAFALFSRITAVTLPLILFLIDYFLERRFTTRVFVEKIPFLILSLVFGIAEIVTFQHQGILKTTESISIVNQVLLGFFAISSYILKFVAPFNLSAIYPFTRETGHALPFLYYLSPVFIAVLGYFIYRSTRRNRAILFGSLFFLVNIILMFQSQILTQGIGFLADRFSYMSYIGFCFLAGWTIEQFVQKKPELKNMVTGVFILILLLFSGMTYSRNKVWENDFTLWNDTISKYPEKVTKSYANRGIAFSSIGQWNEAITDFTKMITIDPKYIWGYLDRGEAYQHTNQWDKSIDDFSKAIEIDSNSQEAFAGRGLAYGALGQNKKAIDDLSKAILIDPKYIKGFSNRGVTYSNMGLYDKAIADLSKAIELDPDYYEAYYNRSIAYGKLSRWDEAIIDGQKAVKFHPDNAGLHDKIGYYYLGKGDLLQAEEEFKKAVNIDVTGFNPYLGLAIVYYSKGYKADAKSYLDQAKGIEPALNTGMDGIIALEKAGYPKPDAVKETLEKMLKEIR